MKISRRLASVEESITLAITARAAELRAAGQDVISLSAGEPDFPTPTVVGEAGIRAIRDGRTRYTAAAGTPELRDIVRRAVKRDLGLEYERAEVCVTASTKPAIYLSLCAILEPGDEIVIPVPYWVSYPDTVRLAGGRPVLLPTRAADGFLPTAADLEAALARPAVCGIPLNSPCNPTGAVWPAALVEDLVGIAARYDRWILSDEIYARILYGSTRHVSPATVPGGRSRTVILNGLSKSHSMTGWRLGYIAAPSELTAAVARAQSHLLGNACSISQAAAEVAFSDAAEGAVHEMVAAFAERRDFLLAACKALPGVDVHPPDGAFYLFVGVGEILARTGGDDHALGLRLLDEAGLAVVPGSAFGRPGFLRLSFATSLDALKEAVRRLEHWLADL